MSFEPGAIVKLKSGGPKMTVNHVDDESAFCIWFDRNKHNEAHFALVTLQLAEEAGEATDGLAERIAAARRRVGHAGETTPAPRPQLQPQSSWT